MRDYMIKSKIEINFICSMQTKGMDAIDAESTVERVIRDIITNNKVLKSLVDNDDCINIQIKSKSQHIFK